MNSRILQILKELVGMYSLSCSGNELEPSKWFYDFFSSMEYFKNHPDLFGLYAIPDDPFARSIPYALLKGRKNDTVIFSGHYDVVTTEDYGAAQQYALDIGSDKLAKALENFELTKEQRNDLETDEWIFGRGVADMKGGLAIHTFLFEEFEKLAQKDELEGSVLFIPVCDEESYSAGMRHAVSIMQDLKQRFDLDYKLLIDPEPIAYSDGAANMSIGTIGKLMPAMIVQGKRAHSGHCYEGISSLSIITEIYQRTNGSLDFVDTYKDEASMPPCWLNMRDMKTGYDVSLPQRSCGYLSCLTFNSTPDEIIAKLKSISQEVIIRQIKKLDGEYQEYKKMNLHENKKGISYEPVVMYFSELKDQLHEKYADVFDSFFESESRRIQESVEKGLENYPSATLKLMNEVLDFSGITEPCVILGFAPPYYPPVNSDLVSGKEGTGSKVYDFLKTINKAYGQELTYENYFTGISDLSYSAVTTSFNSEIYSSNTPLWGKGYAIDFDAIREINVPGIIYGPIGKDYHTFAERVNRKSLFVTVPETTRKLVEFAWEM